MPEGSDEAAQPERKALDARVKRKATSWGLPRSDGFALVFPGRGTALVGSYGLPGIRQDPLTLAGKGSVHAIDDASLLGRLKDNFQRTRLSSSGPPSLPPRFRAKPPRRKNPVAFPRAIPGPGTSPP